MKTLATEFTRLGFTHKLIERTGEIAIYERTKPHYQRSHYEVIIIRTAEPSTRFGKEFPATELYPSAQQWGRLGYTYPDLASAKARAATFPVQTIKTRPSA
jgi:hypothetical protein